MIRNIIFNLVYYIGTLVIGIVIVPSLLLPDRLYWPFIRLYFRWVHVLEKYLLGLDYVVVGRENILSTPYIIAMKHQSAYETLKLPILFDRPTVILKRELLQIPFWGWYAAKSGMIGINRSNAREALGQMVAGVKTALANGSTPVIFPQGTRVFTTDTPTEKPYKRGIAHIYRDANCAVVPVAVNSGLFWPRNSWFKRGGTITFEFLPAIPPGLDETAFMTQLETVTETATNNLVAATTITTRKKSKWAPIIAIILGLMVGTGYALAWQKGAAIFQTQLDEAWKNAPANGAILSPPSPRVGGFPGPYTLTWSGNISTVDAEITAPDMIITFWPVPYTNMTINFPDGVWIENLKTDIKGAETGLKFKSIFARVEIPRYLPAEWIKPEVQKLHDQNIVYKLKTLEINGPVLGDFTPTLKAKGEISYDEELQPVGVMETEFTEPEKIADIIANMIQSPMGKSFAKGAITSLTVTDPVTGAQTLPLTFKLQGGSIYAGPLKIGSIGRYYWPVVSPSN